MKAGLVVAVLSVAAASFLVAVGGPAGAQTVPSGDGGRGREPRTISVSANGIVRGVPDVMDLSLGVDTRAKTAAEALSRNSELARKVIFVLRQAGVAEPDIQTSDLSVYPVYDDDGNAVVAYSVSNIVNARIRDLDEVGGIVDAATEAAGDEIVVNGLYFSFDDNSELVSRARKDAVKRARAQAQELAEAAGVQLGDLLTLHEDYAPIGPALDEYAREGAVAEADAAAPVSPGSEELSVQVSLVYEIT